MLFKFRNFLAAVTVSVFCMGASMPLLASTTETKSDSIQKQLAELEASYGGRLGISATNTANNTHIQYRAEERFPFQSTFKMMGVSAILKRSMTDRHLLKQKMTYSKNDLVYWSPITKKHLVNGVGKMTIAELCAAAISYSDNTAINLLVKKLGGPSAVTAFARSIDDKAFRLNHWEPYLNSNFHKIRDISTPAAMEKSLQKLTLGKVLGAAQRAQLVAWMKANTTSEHRMRAGVPKKWMVADKTGTGSYGIVNDIGVLWPPKKAPIVVSIYFKKNKKYAVRHEEVIAKATHLLIQEFAKMDRSNKY